MSHAGLVNEIRTKLTDIEETILRGDAKDYTAYASCIGRYRVLMEIVQYIDEHKNDDIDSGEPVDQK